MASPATAAFASRRSLIFFRARAFLPAIGLEECWFVCVSCASLCVVPSHKSVMASFGSGQNFIRFEKTEAASGVKPEE